MRVIKDSKMVALAACDEHAARYVFSRLFHGSSEHGYDLTKSDFLLVAGVTILVCVVTYRGEKIDLPQVVIVLHMLVRPLDGSIAREVTTPLVTSAFGDNASIIKNPLLAVLI